MRVGSWSIFVLLLTGLLATLGSARAGENGPGAPVLPAVPSAPALPVAAEVRPVVETESAVAVIEVEADPPERAKELSAARERRAAFEAWEENELQKLDVFRPHKVVLCRCSRGTDGGLPATIQRAEGAVVVVDWQWAVIALVTPRSGTRATWTHLVQKAVHDAERSGEEKRVLVARLEREVASAEAAFGKKDYPGAVTLARGVEAAGAKLRAKAVDRAKELLEKIHAIARQKVKDIDDDFAAAKTDKKGAERRLWAYRVVDLAHELKKQFPFDDIADALKEREARAVAIIRLQNPGYMPPRNP